MGTRRAPGATGRGITRATSAGAHVPAPVVAVAANLLTRRLCDPCLPRPATGAARPPSPSRSWRTSTWGAAPSGEAADDDVVHDDQDPEPAAGQAPDGHREVLGFAVGDSENDAF